MTPGWRSGSRVLVTGAAGFIGSHFVSYLLTETDAEVLTLDRLSGSADLARLTSLDCWDSQSERVRVHWHDLKAPIPQSLIDRIGKVDAIVHFAASSHVDTSIADPSLFVLDNVLGTTHLLMAARTMLRDGGTFLNFSTDEVFGPVAAGISPRTEQDQWNPSNPYAASKAGQTAMGWAFHNTYTVPVVTSYCWDLETRVFSDRGFLSHDEVRNGDKVWTLDDNDKMQLVPVHQVLKFPGPKEMVRIETRKVSQLLTNNHRVLFRRSTGSPRRWGKIEEMPADALLEMPNRIRIPTNGKWDGTIAKFPDGYDPVWLSEVMGWYVSEGFIAKDASGKRTGDCRFGAATQWQVERLVGLLEPVAHWRIGRDEIIARALKQRHVRVYDRKLAAILAQAGCGSENKCIPEFIKQAPPDTLKRFWMAAMLGDGAHIGVPGNEVYYTISKRLAEDMCEVGMKIGYSVRVQSRETWNPRRTKLGKSLMVRFRVPTADVESSCVSRVTNDADVWCVVVPTGRLFIERDGIVSLTGNSMNVFGERQHVEKFLPRAIRHVLLGEEVPIHTGRDGRIGSRTWLHAYSVADAVAHILDVAKPGDAYNIVGPDEQDNLEIAHLVAFYLDKTLKYKLIPGDSVRPGYDSRYAISGAKLAASGWKPPIGFKEAMAKTVRWTAENRSWVGL